MNPKSFLSNFWGSLHFDTPSILSADSFALAASSSPDFQSSFAFADVLARQLSL